jgi:signal transduction histidine kinase
MPAHQPLRETGWVHPEEMAGLLDFWRVYDANHDALVAETAPLLAEGPKSGMVLRSLPPEAMAAASAAVREHLRRAIEEGDWGPYESDERTRADWYARSGLTFADWYETTSVFVSCFRPLLLRAYGDDPRRAEAAVAALHRLHDRRAVVLGEQFMRTREEMVREAEASLRQSETDLQSAQKLAAIGKLAGGVAHDFNNLLAIIVSYTEILGRRVAQDWQALGHIEQIRRACARAIELARQLLIFSRQRLVDPPVLDLSDVVEETERMLRPVLGSRVDLVLRPTRPLDGVKIDRGSLVQVIMNLVVNARDAMPNGGKVIVATAAVLLADERGQGDYAVLAVSDEGIGMDPATRARVFEPFFTTKGPGKGTGLGLATVRGIVEQAGGFVEVRSEPGEGTTFEVFLPCVQAAQPG